MSNHWGRWGSLAALALVAVAGLAGCGGGSTATTSTTTVVVTGKAPAAKRAVHKQQHVRRQAQNQQAKAQRRQRRHHSAGGAKATTATAGKTAKPDRKAESGAAESTSPAAASPAANSLGGATAVEVRKLRKHCPEGVDSSTCTALVEAYVSAQGAESHPVNSPEECTETRSKAECEKVLQEQSESSGGESVDVQECLANMTPKCEEVLRPMFESQQASEAAGG